MFVKYIREVKCEFHNCVTFKYPILPVLCIHILPTEESWYEKCKTCQNTYVFISFII